ncbi:hypothetical protein AUC43_17390 [Hymenobacter sedentarius]|uniref:histidine kinase n=1 Tax=Hymenobacter sedentarius TaxID=1411621 RepID=A0A0U4CEW6_9BACT|nr:ATP-binding protein [Hymenobacter sedentarius]ALW86697.1 hypothetical protein AUC43_17390 [Hymenobacter sedentarius]
MKLLFLLLALLGVLPVLAQTPDPAAIRISRLPDTGLILTNGWRYHAGDNPAWARPEFDDRAWDTINPTRPRRELPAQLSSGISWLRLRFQLSDSLRLQSLVFHAHQLGACEVYLNGRLLMRQGQLNANPSQVVPRGRFPKPGPLPTGGPAVQVLAVRYAPWQSPLLGDIRAQPHQVMWLFTAEQFWTDEARQRTNATAYLVPIGFFALLTLLHWAFFRYNPTRRANLYFAYFALALALAFVAGYCTGTLAYPTHLSFFLVGFTGGALLGLSYIMAVRALYALFKVRPGRLYLGLWVVYVGYLAGFFLPKSVPTWEVLLAIAAVEQLRLIGRALHQGQRGAWIIGSGFAGGLVVLLLLYLTPSGSIATQSTLLYSLGETFAFMLPALGISLFLAREFALDAELLLVKLGEVERLSAQTLAQEQRQQALLATQNDTLEQQVQQRTGELQRSLTELRTTQAQLIQKEKMASLGELTAGIAHEIQNPLNFVNNFSDVSAELMAELQEALATSDTAEATALAVDVTQNLGKIHEHGQRAANIVRGMLEHARPSTGERQPTDINALCDEYLRLAYHGLLAKDKTFTAELKTDFAPGLPQVEGVGADLGRVLLNLFNNAFYAVQKRQQTGEASYAPTVSVSTKQVGQQVEIRFRDNGTGMPPEVQAKIFQPFFTTKPTGEGTGLGLSLSYDIITKSHGGSLRVASVPGESTEFIITLPA